MKKTTKRYPMRTIKEPAFPAGPRAKEIQELADLMVARALRRRGREMALLALKRAGFKVTTIQIEGETYEAKKNALGKVTIRVSRKSSPENKNGPEKQTAKITRQKKQHGAIASSKHAER